MGAPVTASGEAAAVPRPPAVQCSDRGECGQTQPQREGQRDGRREGGKEAGREGSRGGADRLVRSPASFPQLFGVAL